MQSNVENHRPLPTTGRSHLCDRRRPRTRRLAGAVFGGHNDDTAAYTAPRGIEIWSATTSTAGRNHVRHWTSWSREVDAVNRFPPKAAMRPPFRISSATPRRSASGDVSAGRRLLVSYGWYRPSIRTNRNNGNSRRCSITLCRTAIAAFSLACATHSPTAITFSAYGDYFFVHGSARHPAVASAGAGSAVDPGRLPAARGKFRQGGIVVHGHMAVGNRICAQIGSTSTPARMRQGNGLAWCWKAKTCRSFSRSSTRRRLHIRSSNQRLYGNRSVKAIC